MNNTKAAGNLRLKKLNIGAGPNVVSGYLNIDLSYTQEFIYKYKDASDIGVLNANIVNDFPKINGVDVIYSCHFLEHIPLNDAVKFINNCYKSLENGGKLRICVPDFDIWYNAMQNDDNEFFDFYRDRMPYEISSIYKNNFAFFTTMMYGHEHRMTYNFKFLSTLLSNIGFKNIKKSTWGSSDIDKISDLEPVENILRSKESLILEAIK